MRNVILLVLVSLTCVACTNGSNQNIAGNYGYAGDVKYIEVKFDYMQEFRKKSESEQINILSEVVTTPEKLDGIRSIDFNKNYLRSPQDEINIDDNESKVIIQHNSEKIFDKEVNNKDIFIVNENRAIVVIDGVLSDVDILNGKIVGFKVSKYLPKDSTEFKALNKQYSEEYASVEKEKSEKKKAEQESIAKAKAESESIEKAKAESESIARAKAESESKAEAERQKAEEERKKNFSPDNYTVLEYENAMRNEKDWAFKSVQISGKVLQVQNGDDAIHYRIGTQDNGYEGVFLVEISKNSLENRILEDDWVTVYGYYFGVTEYTTVMNAKREIPAILAEKITVD